MMALGKCVEKQSYNPFFSDSNLMLSFIISNSCLKGLIDATASLACSNSVF